MEWYKQGNHMILRVFHEILVMYWKNILTRGGEKYTYTCIQRNTSHIHSRGKEQEVSFLTCSLSFILEKKFMKFYSNTFWPF